MQEISFLSSQEYVENTKTKYNNIILQFWCYCNKFIILKKNRFGGIDTKNYNTGDKYYNLESHNHPYLHIYYYLLIML